jgi:hypothetical protein
MRTMSELSALGVAGDDHNHRWLRNSMTQVKLLALALGVNLDRYTFFDVHASSREHNPDIDREPSRCTQDGPVPPFVVDTALELVEVRRAVPAPT